MQLLGIRHFYSLSYQPAGIFNSAFGEESNAQRQAGNFDHKKPHVCAERLRKVQLVFVQYFYDQVKHVCLHYLRNAYQQCFGKKMSRIELVKARQIVARPKSGGVDRVYHQSIKGAEYASSGFNAYADKNDP